MAEGAGVPVLRFPLPVTGSVAVRDEALGCCIGMDPSVLESDRQHRVHLAHELGHCLTGSFYSRHTALDLRQKHENRADKWAIEALVSPEELDDAVARGCTDLWSLAEHFGVTEAFMKKVVCWYTHGNLAEELYF